ncbi:MAG: co-chaperone GroES [Nitrospiria bacterium]
MAGATATSVKFRPLKERVFVSYSEEPDKTSSGLYIPDAAKEKPQKGKVEAIGNDVKDVKVGETILFDKYSGSKINLDNQEYLILKEEDILGVVE